MADIHYRHRLLLVPKYMHIQFTVLLWNKKEERRKLWYHKNVNFTAFFVKVHVIANSCKSQCLFSFEMNSKQFCCFNNFNSLLLGYYQNKIETGRGLEKLCKINNVVAMLNEMKNFCCLDLKCSVMFCFTSNFHRICLNLYATLFMA